MKIRSRFARWFAGRRARAVFAPTGLSFGLFGGWFACFLLGCSCFGAGVPGDAPAALPVPVPGSVRRGSLIHDPSTVMRFGADYWVFGTGQGITSLHSRDLVTWERGPRVFDTAPGWIRDAVPGNKGHLWAPDLCVLQGRYCLYYSVSQWGKNASVIALATNATLDPSASEFAWRDQGPVIRSVEGDDFNAIDPCVVRDAKGGVWLGFGSFWGGIRLVELDPVTGKRRDPDGAIFSLAFHESIEAPYICWRAPYHYLFVNWGACCRGTNSTYEIRVGRSSGVTGPYLDKDGVDLMRGGGSLLLGTRGVRVGPGHLAMFEANGRSLASVHYYDANNGGRGTLGFLDVRWDKDGWPVLAWEDMGPMLGR